MKTLFPTSVLTLFCTMLFSQSNTFSYKTTNNNEVILLSEGQRQGQADILIGATPEMRANTIPNGTFPNATNAFLVRTITDKHVLIDAGYGHELFRNLEKFKVTPDMIDVILITHMHGDHIGGLLGKEKQKAFPNAQLYLSKIEFDYYSNPATRGHKAAMDVFNAYREKLVLINNDEPDRAPVADLFQAIPCPGHTPGHLAYLIDNLLIWGDITHAMAIQMQYPEVAVTYDFDGKQAVGSRLNILQFVINNNLSVAGMHIPYPGMGAVKQHENGYVFTPMNSESSRK